MAGKMQQYIRTEYIQPPPGPPLLDAKNSPLALLAQTCSAIGKEPALPNKHAIHSKFFYSTSSDPKKLQNNNHLKVSSCTSPAALSPKQSLSPATSDHRRASPHRSLKREKSPNQCSSPTKKSCASPEMRESFKRRSEDGKLSSSTDPKKLVANESKRHHPDETDSMSVKADPSLVRQKSSSPHNTRICACPSSTSSSLDTSRPLTQSVSPQQQQLMSLYDPFCLGCQGPHVAGNPCLDSLKSPLPFYPFANPASTYPYYAQMLMAATARSNGAAMDASPHVCNWMSANGNCGKRFSTAEELFNHLRTHAVSNAATNSANNYLMSSLEKMAVNPYAAYLSQQAAAIAAVSPPATNPIASNFLPRSRSPLSRYHPYKSPNMLSQISGLPSLPIPAGVGPYCSPYALYGQRLGATTTGFSYH